MFHLPSCRVSGVLLLALLLASTGCGPKVKLVNVIPATFSSEYVSDGEPNIAVNPADPRRIVISAFTSCPWTMTEEAPIYFSINDGETWALNCILPGHGTSRAIDITVRFAGSSGVLYAGILLAHSNFHLNILRTSDFTSVTPMTVLVDQRQEDQPYTQAFGDHGGDHVYIGNNIGNDSGTPERTASLYSSLGAATAAGTGGFSNQLLESRETCGADLPSVRPAIHPSGVIYVAYLRTAPGSPCGITDPTMTIKTNTADVVVVRDDNWGTEGYQALKDNGDHGDRQVGVRVATGLYMSSFGNLGSERVGDQLSIAVNPKDSQTVYVAWGDGANPGDFILHVRGSSDGGQTWSTSDLKTVLRATNPALAINDDGQIGFLYQQLVKPGTCKGGAGEGCWETHFERLKGGQWQDLPHPLANVPEDVKGVGGFPLGDYIHVMAVGDKFYGVFSANNYPDKENFYPGVKYQRHVDWCVHALFGDAAHTMAVKPSVDPYFFTVDE